MNRAERRDTMAANLNHLRVAYEITMSFADSVKFAKTNMGARCWAGNLSAIEAGIIDGADWRRAGKGADEFDKAQVEALVADLRTRGGYSSAKINWRATR